jgi:hypothetical protein
LTRLVLRSIAVIIFFSAVTGFCGNPSHETVKSDESYLFPTDASHRINSDFADYRANHFHGGIDISTNGKIGYPVYAAKSGYVYRVSVSPFGYGKRIILRHNDSTFTLYGHLSAFTGESQRLVESEQQTEGKYDVDMTFSPNAIRVTRGEMIARTGATGDGGPHLHFEVHDSDYSFVDPLAFRSLDVTRYMRPRIFNVAVRGFESGRARVCGVMRRGNVYRARETFRMTEPFFFIVHAADSYGRGRFKRPPKRIELKIDGKGFISVNLTKFRAADYLDVASLVDLHLSHSYKTYYKLCVDRAIPFTVFTPSSPLSGLVHGNLPDGKHTYEITVKDEDDNSSSVTGRFILELNKSKEKQGPPEIQPFAGKDVSPMPGVTLHFPADAFVENVDLEVRKVSESAFVMESEGKPLRRKVLLTWKIDDPKLQLFRRGRHGWIHEPCRNDGHVLTARIGYETGEFALIRDDVPPSVGIIRVSKKNPFYRSVAPTEFRRYFVYFKVFDNLSNVDTDDIFLRAGTQEFLCEYDVDKRAVVCNVDAALLRREKYVEILVRDNAGNRRTVKSRLGF